MKFAKEGKNYFLDQLKGAITNNFSFSIKSLHRDSAVLDQPLLRCAHCTLPLTSSVCEACKSDNKLPAQTKLVDNFVHREKMEESDKMEQSMILCIDLSGSMCCSYQSKYKKVNEDLVKRVLGEKNFDYLKKKIGIDKVMKNYLDYSMFLNEGESARNIAEMVRMEETSKYHSSSGSGNSAQTDMKQKEAVEEYISRKEIIEIAVSKLLTIIAGRNPNTYITVVYFNDTLEIPTDNFNEKLVIAGLDTKNVEQMINLGVEYSTQISKAKASNIGQNLVMNLTKSYENGQTALGPALAFCMGLAKSFKHCLSQIVIVTDGMSNIGFGQTENELLKEENKQFYEKLAFQYAKPLNCVVDVVTFEDCCIGYDQLDGLVSLTGGIPCQIQFSEHGGEKIVTEQTFTSLSFKMVTSFCEYTNQLCFDTKITIMCSNDKIKIRVSDQLKPFITKDNYSSISLKLGIISSSLSFKVQFSLPADLQQFEGIVTFRIVAQFKRNNKMNVSCTSHKIKVVKGTKQQAEKEELVSLQKQMKDKLKTRQIFEEDVKQYENISMKMGQNQQLMQGIDKDLLDKFNKKKEMLQAELKTIDKLAMQKMSMRSRAQRTFKPNEDDFDDGFV